MKALIPVLAVLALVGISPKAEAATITYSLNCQLVNGGCTALGQTFGTVTLEDTAANQVKISVNLLNSGIKFRDLMLNLTGFAGTDITVSSESPNMSTDLTISANGFSISPYAGLFDLGQSGGQGWNTTSSPYSAFLAGVGATLSASNFNAKDSLGNTYVGIHLQSIACTSDTSCTPGQTGQGSIKLGANDQGIRINEVPEPMTVSLLGLGLVGMGLVKRARRK